MTIWLLLISVIVIAISGFPGLLLSRQSALGQWLAAALNLIGSGLGGAALVLQHVHPELSHEITSGWGLPLGRFAIAIDDISLIFLIPMFLISATPSPR